jgi:hypothetical protein
LGVATRDQLAPFQCSARVREAPVLAVYDPTAQASDAESADTACRTGPSPGLGLATRDQLVPFHCSTRVLKPLLVLTPPTANALEDELALTPLRKLCNGLGFAIRDQSAPFQCSTRDFEVPLGK